MIDTLLAHRELAEKSDVLERLKLTPQTYGVLTLHRPANVDDPRVLAGILDALEEIQRTTPLVFPVHPRTRGNLERRSQTSDPDKVRRGAGGCAVQWRRHLAEESSCALDDDGQ